MYSVTGFEIPSRMWREFWQFFIPAGSAWFLLIRNKCDGVLQNPSLGIWMFWVGYLRGARSVSSFCDFREKKEGGKSFVNHRIKMFSFLIQANLGVFRCSYSLILPSYLLGISRNQAEPAGMKNFQNSRHIWGRRISNPCHTRGGMSRNDAGMGIRYIFLDNYAIPRCSELRPDSFEGQSGRSDCTRAAIERFRRHSNCIPAEFFQYRNRFRQQSRCCIQSAFRLIRDILAGVAGRFDSPSNAIRMFWMP